ncbi:MAG: hypothetical protein AAB425_00580 [Bdellovibrionota bacterium]
MKSGISSLLSLLAILACVSSTQAAEKSETKIQGKVLDLRIVPLTSKTAEPGVELTVHTASGDVIVLVGPAWIKANKELGIGRGDEVMVVGVRASLDELAAVFAKDVRKIK